MASRANKRPADDVVVIDESVASEPVATESVASEPVATEPVASEPVASEPAGTEPAAAPAPRAAGAARRWNEIQAMFVDDPRGSVELAAGMAGQAIEDLVASFRQREAALTSAWQDGDAGTEALRNALKDYRAFCGAIRDISASGPTAASQAQRRRQGADA
jgi:hypothetical protein